MKQLRNKLFWQYLVPMMYRFPPTRRLAVNIWTRTLLKHAVESVANYHHALDLMNNSELSGNPFWDISCALLAFQALLPAAIIYGYAKSAEAEVTKRSV